MGAHYLMLIPRDYQGWSTDAALAEVTAEAPENFLVLLPQGTGKSVVITLICLRMLALWPGIRILVVTDSKELVAQDYEKFCLCWPDGPHGIVSAGLNRRDVGCQIVFAGVKTALNCVSELGPRQVILIDEAHKIPDSPDSVYQKLIRTFERYGRTLCIGFTATDWRTGKGRLCDQENAVFSKVVFDACSLEAYNWFIEQGYLCDLVSKKTGFVYDVSNVKTGSDGDYNKKQLQKEINKRELTEAAMQEVLAVAAAENRQHWLIFCGGIEHAEDTQQVLLNMGVACGCVHSKSADRDEQIRRFKTGKDTAITNNGILTTGFDYNQIDLIICLRPSKSENLWGQILGRGTRPVYADGFDLASADGRLAAIAASCKPNCRVMDFAGNTRRLGQINNLRYRVKGEGGGVAPVRECDACGEHNAASARVCKACGEPFPEPKPKITHVTDGEPVRAVTKDSDIQDEPIIVEVPVASMTFSPHRRIGKPERIKVSYICGLSKYDQYLAVDPADPLFGLTKKHWALLFSESKKKGDFLLQDQDYTYPTTMEQALSLLPRLPAPKKLTVWINHKSKYPRIMAHAF